MNFLDAYDISGPPTPSASQQPETSLNEEVSQVVGQLSRFWGGFRKQSQTVIEAARKDLGEVVSQAQKELSKLTAEAEASGSDTTTAEHTTEDHTEETAKDIDVTPSASASASTASISTTGDSEQALSDSHSQPQSQTLLARLQASLPPQLVSSVQEKLPDSIKHARGLSLSAPDFATLRSTLASELQRVQGGGEVLLQRVQGSSEGLLNRVQGSSEELLREASEFLKDAVRVVPPEEDGSSQANSGVVWDGTDVWMIPTYADTGSAPRSASRLKGKEKEHDGRRSQSVGSGSGSGRPSMDGVRAATTRAEAMLVQLRHDPQVLRADPAAEGDAFGAWVEKEVDADGIGGIEGDSWNARVVKEMGERQEVGTLYDTLVPEEMDAATFWKRYFFRVHQVEREEERRKALLQGTIDNEEDFSWEDDEEEASSPTTAKVPAHDPATPATAVPATATLPQPVAVSTPTERSRVSTPAMVSSRPSSEDSYDVVSSQASRGGSASGADSVVRENNPEGEKKAVEDEDDDEDESGSDWE